jgi:hypothetical protein
METFIKVIAGYEPFKNVCGAKIAAPAPNPPPPPAMPFPPSPPFAIKF